MQRSWPLSIRITFKPPKSRKTIPLNNTIYLRLPDFYRKINGCGMRMLAILTLKNYREQCAEEKLPPISSLAAAVPHFSTGKWGE